MKTHSRNDWRCTMPRSLSLQLPFLVLILIVLCMQATFASAADVEANVWLSGPASLWGLALSQPISQKLIVAAVQADFTAAIWNFDNGATVSVVSMESVASKVPADGPLYGAQALLSVTNTALSKEEVASALRASDLPQINGAVQPIGFTGVVRVLEADGPSVMNTVGPVLLPVTGSTFFWTMVLDTVNSKGAGSMDVFMTTLQDDIQNAVDPTLRQYLVETTPLTNVVNASSWYVSYSVWAFPNVAITPGTSADLKALAMKSAMPKFNDFVKTLTKAYPELEPYSDLHPKVVKAWVPPPGNPFDDDDDSESDKYLHVLTNETGDYLLLFSGDQAKWRQLWEKSRNAISKSIEDAIEVRLHRRIFLNKAVVISAEALPADSMSIGGLQVLCRVVQGIMGHSDQPWSPEQVAALLLQADYSATQALYTSDGDPAKKGMAQSPAATPQINVLAATPEKTPGSIATAAVSYDYRTPLSKELVGIIVMSVLIVSMSLAAIIITVSCRCCCPQFIGGDANGKRSSIFYPSVTS
ncbi:hypothetical protein, unknown function [Leishmania tarentolae]|uniref:Uncharacterized protein n=1 Tax=Leishmania tarentolae TaxID=5689 RepID=A0A640KM38_LEITA|nr:hypothetical protein, unknown function [Leishmania tarentolae]